MRYRSFGDYARGYSHVKNGTDCEDYALSYSDPKGRYHICTVCDGHSDNNCFRSSQGARYGCESAVEVLRRFFDLYLDQEEGEKKLSKAMEERLKRSIKQSWEDKVQEHVREHELTEEELSPLTDSVRRLYESGQRLSHIYGATFLAAAICQDFFLVLHIGDGLLLCVDPDGDYYVPLLEDPKSNTGSPASLCDEDLLTRKEAFQSLLTTKLPQAVIVSSDGIGDCMDELQSREFVWELFAKFEKQETTDDREAQGLNQSQKEYLKSCLTYWADQGNGAEDDCSLAGIYDLDARIPMVKLPLEEIEQRWNAAIAERDEMLKDYEQRKKEILQKIEQRMHDAARLDTAKYKEWIELNEKLEEMKQVLQNMQKNEAEKMEYYEKKLEGCREYFRRTKSSAVPAVPPVKLQRIETRYLEKDPLFAEVKKAQKSLFEKEVAKKEISRRLEEARTAEDEAYRQHRKARKETEMLRWEQKMRQAKHTLLKTEQEFEEAFKEVERAKTILKETISRSRKMKGEPSGKRFSIIL